MATHAARRSDSEQALERRRAAAKRARGTLAKYTAGRMLSEELIAERRAEAGHERRESTPHAEA